MISPSLGWYTPETILMKVDLPAPLSPIRPITWPGKTSMLTSLTAVKPPKRLVRFFALNKASMLYLLLAQLAPELVDDDGQDQHDTDSHILPEGHNAQQHQPVLDRSDDQRADDCANDR